MTQIPDVEGRLAEFRASLLFGMRVPLDVPDGGYRAFERHQLMAIRFHRAARLNSPPPVGERAGWRIFFKEHFPRGDEHADLLWERWRIALLKDEYPGPGVALMHAQPQGHWQLLPVEGQEEPALYVNIESMWDDFEGSVDSMIDLLRDDPTRREVTFTYWASRQWAVYTTEL